MLPKEIEITINGFPEKAPPNITIAALLKHMEEKDAHVIVELNHKVVFPQRYSDTVVQHGDTLEFINPDFGG
jgi:thiamine biosynthesis protein ThiS